MAQYVSVSNAPPGMVYADEVSKAFYDAIAVSEALPRNMSAWSATSSVLGELLTRVDSERARQFVAAMPKTLKTQLKACLQSGQVEQTLDCRSYVHGVMQRLQLSEDRATALARTVFVVMQNHLPGDPVSQLEKELPEGLAELWRKA